LLACPERNIELRLPQRGVTLYNVTVRYNSGRLNLCDGTMFV